VGYEIVECFNDPAVSGADPIESRLRFAALPNRIEGNGVRVCLLSMPAGSLAILWRKSLASWH
jgi:hypothetical protein